MLGTAISIFVACSLSPDTLVRRSFPIPIVRIALVATLISLSIAGCLPSSVSGPSLLVLVVPPLRLSSVLGPPSVGLAVPHSCRSFPPLFLFPPGLIRRSLTAGYGAIAGVAAAGGRWGLLRRRKPPIRLVRPAVCRYDAFGSPASTYLRWVDISL